MAERIAYLYNRSVAPVKAWGDVHRIFRDNPSTRRMFRADMIDRGGLREGDTLVLVDRADIGRGREIPILLAKVESMGVTVEIIPTEPESAPRKPGRASKLAGLTDDQRRRMAALWNSAEDPQWVLEECARIAGRERVTRNQMYRAFGRKHEIE